MGYRVGVDIGGTFTDLQVLDEETGELREAKVCQPRRMTRLSGSERAYRRWSRQPGFRSRT